MDVTYANDTLGDQRYILLLNYSLDFTKSMENSTLCSNQEKSSEIIVDDVPKILNVRKKLLNLTFSQMKTSTLAYDLWSSTKSFN